MENAAKRRKTYGGTVQWESHSTTSSPPPAQDPRENLASETGRIFSSSQSVIVPVANNAVSGVTRSQTKPRISSGGRIQKPQMSRRVPGVVPKDQEESMTYVLRYQVFKHIKDAIKNSQYRANMTSGNRGLIGTKVGLNLGSFRRR